ncbi:MAG: hypothetical protein K6E11_04285 [Bacilli bacterium]|nr:hypothetical protein [Bacilli bacterium]
MKKLLLIAPLALSLLLVSCNNKDNENKGSDEEQTSQDTPTSGDQTPPEDPWKSLLPKELTEFKKLNIVGTQTVAEALGDEFDEDVMVNHYPKLIKDSQKEMTEYGIDEGMSADTSVADYYKDDFYVASLTRNETFGTVYQYTESYTDVGCFYNNIPIIHEQGSVVVTASGSTSTKPYDSWNTFPSSGMSATQSALQGLISLIDDRVMGLEMSVLTTDDFYYIVTERTTTMNYVSPMVYSTTDFEQNILEINKDLQLTGYYYFSNSIADKNPDTGEEVPTLMQQEASVDFLTYGEQVEYENKTEFLASLPGHTVMIDYNAGAEQYDRKSYINLKYKDATVDGDGNLTAVGSSTNEGKMAYYLNGMLNYEYNLTSSTGYVAISEIDIALLIKRITETPNGEEFQVSFQYSNSDATFMSLQAAIPNSSLQTLDGTKYIVLQQNYVVFVASFNPTLVEPSFTFEAADAR